MPGQLSTHASNDANGLTAAKKFDPRTAKAFCEGLNGTFDPSQTGSIDPELLNAAIRGTAGGAGNCPQCAAGGPSPSPVPTPPTASADVAQFMPPIVEDDRHHLDVTVVITGQNNLMSQVDLDQGDTPTEAAQKVEARLAQWVQNGELLEAGRSGTVVSATPADDLILIYDE